MLMVMDMVRGSTEARLAAELNNATGLYGKGVVCANSLLDTTPPPGLALRYHPTTRPSP